MRVVRIGFLISVVALVAAPSLPAAGPAPYRELAVAKAFYLAGLPFNESQPVGDPWIGVAGPPTLAAEQQIASGMQHLPKGYFESLVFVRDGTTPPGDYLRSATLFDNASDARRAVHSLYLLPRPVHFRLFLKGNVLVLVRPADAARAQSALKQLP